MQMRIKFAMICCFYKSFDQTINCCTATEVYRCLDTRASMHKTRGGLVKKKKLQAIAAFAMFDL